MPSDRDHGSTSQVPDAAGLLGSVHFARRLLATLPGMVYLCDLRTGVHLYQSHDLRDWLGFAEGVGEGPAIHPEDAGAVREHRARMAVADDADRHTLEFRIRHADGRWHWLRSREVVFARDPDGTASQGLGTAEDITEERRARVELQASEEMFSRAFRLSPDSINITRLEDGVYLDINEGFTRTTGYTREDAIGRPSTSADLAVWARDEDRARLVAGLKANGEVTGLEARFRRKDGSLLHGLMSARVIEIHGEKAVLSISRDITARKQAEAALKAALAFNEQIISSAQEGILVYDQAGRLIQYNSFIEKLTGVPAQELFRGTPGQAFAFLDPADALAGFQRALAGELVRHPPTRWSLANGRSGWVTSVQAPLIGGQGEAIGVIETVTDVSELRRAQALQTHLEAELHQAQKLESLGSLAGGIAHDMNNVLAAIQAVTETLRFVHAGEGPLVKALETIEKASTRGRDLVRSLTNFARKDLRQPELLDLNALVREEMELLRRTTLQKVELAMELEPALPAVLGERGTLGSALMNLCVNAVDAMPRGGALTIRTRLRPDAQVELAVQDNGQGMAPAVLARAMEPYFTTKPQGKGTGLGLAMVYATAKAHGGTVSLASAEGQGTSATLVLPVSGTAAGPAPAPSAAAPSACPMSILLVDDDELIRASVPPMVEFFGHQVAVAPGGREALRILREGKAFDLVILDLNMPGMDGLETLRHLRRQRPELPVLLATGRLDDATVNALRRDGRALGIFKPFSMAELDLKFKVLETIRPAGAAAAGRS